MKTKMVQIRDVDADTVDVLKSRAAAAGMNLSDYLKRQLEIQASSPTNAEILERAVRRPRRELGVTGATAVRAHRDEYE